MRRTLGLVLAAGGGFAVAWSAEIPAAAGPVPLRVLSDANYPPYTYLEGGEAKGLGIDLLRELATRIGRPIEIELLEWQQAQDRVLRGEGDALFPMSVTPARRATYDFSEPVFELNFSIFTLASRTGVSDLADLRGLRVGVTGGGLPRQLVQDDPQIRPVTIHDYAHGFTLLLTGEIDAVLADQWVGSYELAARNIEGVRRAERVVATLPAAVAVRRGDTALLATLDAGLQALRADGTITRIRERWQPQEVVFVTRAQLQHWLVVGGFAVLLLLLAVMGAWTAALRREIAVRRTRDAQVAALHQRLAIATRAGGIGIWDWDVAANVLVWDDEMYHLYGVRREDFAGAYAAWQQALHPDDRATEEAKVREVLAKPVPYDVEFRICRPDGAVRTIKATAEVFRDGDGRAVRLVGINQDVTARQQAEQAMRASEEKFAKVFRASPVAIALTQLPDGRVIEVNESMARMLACRREDLLGRTTEELGIWEDVAIRHRLLAEVQEAGTVRVPDLRFRTRTGGVVISEFAAERITIDGRPHLISVLADVTARHRAEAEVRELLGEAERARTALLGILEDQKRAEEALRASESRFRSAMEHSAIGMALVATDGRWLEVNPALCRITGYTRAEMLATTFQAVTHPADLPEDLGALRELLAGALETHRREKRYLHKEGHVVWIQLNVALLRDAAGQPVRFIVQIQDITERHRAAAALAESAGRLELALQASQLGLWRRHLLSGRAEWDARTLAIFGLPADRPPPAGAEFLAFVVEEDRERVRAAMLRSEAYAARAEIRHRIRRADGAVRHLETHSVVQPDKAGQPEWVLGVVADVTEIVHAAEEAERLRDQLLQAQKMETLGTLAAGIAHDFNNLLTGINGFIELGTLSVPPGGEAADFLTNARRGVMQARDLVRRILQFSRRSAGAQRTLVRLDEVVRDTAPLIAAVLPANVSLAVEAEPDTPPVLADTGQIQQVLMNLCVNGAHAIGAAAGTVRLAVGRRQFARDAGEPPPAGCRPGEYARLAVTDSGCGMDEATQARIFEPFFTTKQAGEGTGLGLAVVKGIIADHAGAVRVRSAVGQGTTFELLLPAAPVVEPVASAPAAPAAARGGGQRILVVDDEPAIANVARLALARAGYQVDTRTSPLEAWRMIADAPAQFDLLLVDLQMPELPGAELVRRVRGVAPALPVIVMSGQLERVDAGGVQRFGGVSMLEKPFDIEQLAKVVAVALRGAVAP